MHSCKRRGGEGGGRRETSIKTPKEHKHTDLHCQSVHKDIQQQRTGLAQRTQNNVPTENRIGTQTTSQTLGT